MELAESENIELWQQAIAHWMQQYQAKKVSLWQLQQALGMPLVEVWLCLLHSQLPYLREQQGEFYRQHIFAAASGLWLHMVWVDFSVRANASNKCIMKY